MVIGRINCLLLGSYVQVQRKCVSDPSAVVALMVCCCVCTHRNPLAALELHIPAATLPATMLDSAHRDREFEEEDEHDQVCGCHTRPKLRLHVLGVQYADSTLQCQAGLGFQAAAGCQPQLSSAKIPAGNLFNVGLT